MSPAVFAVKNCSELSRENDSPKDIRNISRLPDRLRNKLGHINTFSVDPKVCPNIKLEREEKRRLFAVTGENSGIDPSVCWDTVEEYHEHIAQDLMRPSLEEAARVMERSNRLKQEQLQDKYI